MTLDSLVSLLEHPETGLASWHMLCADTLGRESSKLSSQTRIDQMSPKSEPKAAIFAGLLISMVIFHPLGLYFSAQLDDQRAATHKANEEVAERCMREGGR